jgi:hypothetical protein
MVPDAIQEHLGKPTSVERKDVTGVASNVEIHHYDGMTLEYDRLDNGNLVVGGVIIAKSTAAPATSAPAPSASARAPDISRAGRPKTSGFR